jgi:hypothetical protein
MKIAAAILSLIVGVLALGVADGSETSRRAVKLYGTASYPAACRLPRLVGVGKRSEAWVPGISPCVPLMPCGPQLVYRYEIQPGGSSGLPYCPDAVLQGPWR